MKKKLTKKFEGVLKMTEREFEIFQKVGEGMLVSDISKIPGRTCSRATVATHLDRICVKVGLVAGDRRRSIKLAIMATEYRLSGLKRVPNIPAKLLFKFA